MKGKTPIIIGVVILALVVIAACVAGGIFLFTQVGGNAQVVEYNNTTVEARDEVITNIRSLTSSFAGTDESVQSAIDELDGSIETAEAVINDTEVPSKGEKIKEMNLEYISLAKQLSDDAKAALEVKTDNFDEYDDYITALEAYDQTLLQLSQLNIDIAQELNDIVGYEAVPQSEIDSLQSQHDQLEASINSSL